MQYRERIYSTIANILPRIESILLAGSELRILVQSCDVNGLFTRLPHPLLLESLIANADRFRRSHDASRRYPNRSVDRITVSKQKVGGRKLSRRGPAYNDEEQVSVLLSDIIEILNY